MLKLVKKHPITSIGVLVLFLFGFSLELLPITIMEGRNFCVARDMLTENNWFLTTMNDIPRYEKPPFPAWFSAPFVKLFGIHQLWAYRLPTVVMAWLCGLVWCKLLALLTNQKDFALYGALILMTSFYFIGIVYEAPSDMFTHTATLLSIYCIINFLNSKKLQFLVVAVLAFAISILSKGPIGFYALYLPFIIGLFASKTYTLNIKNLLPFLSVVLLGGILGFSWYFYVRYADPEHFLSMTAKETENWSSYNVKPFYYYWSFFTQSGIWTIPALAGLLLIFFRKKISLNKTYLLMFWWTIAAIVLLSFIPEKKSRYLFPVLIPLSGIIWYTLFLAFKHVQHKLIKFIIVLHHSLILLALVTGLGIYFLLNTGEDYFWAWYGIWAIASLLFIYHIVKYLNRMAIEKLFLTNVLLVATITSLGFYAVGFAKQNENYTNAQAFKQYQEFELPAYYYKEIEPEIYWEFGKNSEDFNSNKPLPNRFNLIVSETNVEEVKEEILPHFKLVENFVFDRNYFNNKTMRKYRPRFVLYVFTLEKN